VPHSDCCFFGHRISVVTLLDINEANNMICLMLQAQHCSRIMPILHILHSLLLRYWMSLKTAVIVWKFVHSIMLACLQEFRKRVKMSIVSRWWMYSVTKAQALSGKRNFTVHGPTCHLLYTRTACYRICFSWNASFRQCQW